jgi:hypothetical protein
VLLKREKLRKERKPTFEKVKQTWISCKTTDIKSEDDNKKVEKKHGGCKILCVHQIKKIVFGKEYRKFVNGIGLQITKLL